MRPAVVVTESIDDTKCPAAAIATRNALNAEMFSPDNTQ
jgi:hypothetical protein